MLPVIYVSHYFRFERLKRASKQTAEQLHSTLDTSIKARHRKYQKMAMDEYEMLEHLKVMIVICILIVSMKDQLVIDGVFVVSYTAPIDSYTIFSVITSYVVPVVLSAVTSVVSNGKYLIKRLHITQSDVILL